MTSGGNKIELFPSLKNFLLINIQILKITIHEYFLDALANFENPTLIQIKGIPINYPLYSSEFINFFIKYYSQL